MPLRFLLLAALVASACGKGGGAPAGSPTGPRARAHQPRDEPATSADRGHAHATIHHRFESAARWSKVFDDPERDSWQKPDAVVAALELEPDQTVADLGCGTGYFVERLARAVPRGRVLAIDIEPDMLRWVDRRVARSGITNVETVLAAKDDPRLPSGVDLVLVVDTYHHLDDRSDYFRRVRRKLSRGGRVVVVDFKMGKLPVGPPDRHKIPPEEIDAEMTRAGFTQCESFDELPYQHVLFFAERC